MEERSCFPRWIFVPFVLLAVNGLLVSGIYLSGAYGRESVPLQDYDPPSCAEIRDDLDSVTYGLFCPEER